MRYLFRLTAIWEAFRVATASLRSNKLRTALTLVGIVVGVAAVIAVVTIIKGLNQTVAQTFSSQGSTVFTISKNPQIIKSREDFIKFNRRKDVTHEDAEAVMRLCTACWRVGIAANAIETVKYADQKAENVRIRGVDVLRSDEVAHHECGNHEDEPTEDCCLPVARAPATHPGRDVVRALQG